MPLTYYYSLLLTTDCLLLTTYCLLTCKALEGRAGDFRAALASHNTAFEAVTRQVGAQGGCA